MTNRDLYSLNAALEMVFDIEGTKLGYAVARNQDKVASALHALDHRRTEPHPLEGEFEEKRIGLCSEHCEKDADGSPVLIENRFQGLEDNEAFQKGLDELREAYKVVLDHRKEGRLAFELLLDEECDIKLYTFDFEKLPGNLTARQIAGIMPMLTNMPEVPE